MLTLATIWRHAVGGMSAAGRLLRRLMGAPDYERYLAHVRRCHPGATPLSAERFLQERLEARYDRPGSRCC